MRFLKNKILLAHQHAEKLKERRLVQLEKELNHISSFSSESSIYNSSTSDITLKRTRKNTSTINIIKNYGRAAVSFGLSKTGKSYLTSLVTEYKIDISTAYNFLNNIKCQIKGLHTFKRFILPQQEDSSEIAVLKHIFRKLCEIFLKCYSVNWIFNSKLSRRIVHLNFRFKLLRRVRNPQMFESLVF